jgi:hypothetical protein
MFIVRVYRFHRDAQKRLVGVVEEVGVEGKRYLRMRRKRE